MSTSSFQARKNNTSSKALNAFSLSALPLILILGFFMALTGCTVPTGAITKASVASTSISDISPEQVAPKAFHISAASGGRLS